eukprot:286106-Chlamydomonas_euryale.AAC.6
MATARVWTSTHEGNDAARQRGTAAAPRSPIVSNLTSTRGECSGRRGDGSHRLPRRGAVEWLRVQHQDRMRGSRRSARRRARKCATLDGAMASVTGKCSLRFRPSAGPARPSRSPRATVMAATWREVDRAAPLLIQANGQPIMAPRTEGGGDPYAALLRQRTVFMSGEVEDFGADALVSQLLLLDAQEQGKDIRLFINSPEACMCGGVQTGMHGYPCAHECMHVETCCGAQPA